jgi:predicted GIY-YIG superfamily endonuclease/transposase
MYHLYYLTSTIDDRIYIGITNNPKRRYEEHINYTVEKKHYNGNWIRSVLKKGGEIRMKVALSNLSKKTAIELEIKLIDFFKRLIPEKVTNTAAGGLGFNHKGIPHSESHKKAIEAAQPHKVRIPKEHLFELYVNKKLSKKKIGDMYGCGATTIDRRLNEYEIPIRNTPNYKVSYKLNKNEILDMYIEKKMTITEISEKLEIGSSGIRYLLQREGIDTGLNKFRKSLDREKVKQKYEELIKMKIKKMKIYQILSNEFGLSSGYLSKLRYSE